LIAKDIRVVGVLGAGTMGRGIAQVCAQSGYEVLLYDSRPEAADLAVTEIDATLEKLVSKGRLASSDRAKCLQHLIVVRNFSSLVCDIIIEAVIEDLTVKQHLLAEVEKVNSNETIVASNTSSISITHIASGLQHPTRCVGLHFFNPAPLMKLVEVVAGSVTDPFVVKRTVLFAQSLGKTPVVTQDSPGFIVNRVARHFYVEALKLLEEGATTPDDVDYLAKASGFKMGPFELMDLIGIDVNFSVTQSLFRGFHYEPRFRPNRLQEQKVLARQLGRKTGQGFYDYEKT